MALKALFRKQLLELNTFYFFDAKSGKRRSKGKIALYCLLFGFVFFSVAMIFIGAASGVGAMLLPLGKDWLYFAIMGVLSILLGTFGSVFNTYAGLYHARDNELLLSMPIKPMQILTVRTASVVLMSLLYTALAWVPTFVIYFIIGTPSITSIVYSILLTIVLSVFVSVLTCALGWVVALIASKLKNKSFITVLLTLAFLAIYYLVYFKISDIFSLITNNIDKVGEILRKWVFPVYALGCAAAGSSLYMLLFTAITAVLFALCVYILSRSFTKIVTTAVSSKKKRVKAEKSDAASPSAALLRREWKRFTSSPTYLMNCGLGAILMPIAMIALLIKASAIREAFAGALAETSSLAGIFPALIAGVLCFLAGMDGVTAPSVSLEGKSIWIAQTLPIESEKILRAKVHLHLIVNLLPTLLCGAVFAFVFELSAIETASLLFFAVCFVWFTALLGLFANLKKPNLVWTNETVPIKQGMPVAIVIFGSMGIGAVVIGASLLLMQFVPVWATLLGFGAALALAAFFLQRYVHYKGSEIYRYL